MVVVPDPVINPSVATVLNAVITWYGMPPIALEVATLTVDATAIDAGLPLVTVSAVGTATVDSPACATGK